MTKQTRIAAAAAVMAAAFVATFALIPRVSRAQARDYQNFVIILDHSNAMNLTDDGKSRNYRARKVSERMFNNIDRLGRNYKAALYMYGIMAAENENRVLKLHGWSDFDLMKFQLALDEAEAQVGPATLSVALRDLRRDMQEKNITGNTAVFIISSGNLMDVGDEVDAAKELKLAHPGVCIYPILVGDNRRGKKNLNDVEGKGKCGFSVNVDALHSGPEVEAYIHDIFGEPGARGGGSDTSPGGDNWTSKPDYDEIAELNNVTNLVFSWADAWEKNTRSVDQYMGYYSKNFRSNYEEGYGLDYNQWRSAKQAEGRAAGCIDVQVSDIKVEFKGNMAIANFSRKYVTRSDCTAGQKKLYLSREGGKWKIVGEVDVNARPCGDRCR